MQKLIVSTVRNAGGEGQKLTNKFSTGVVDLLLKLPHATPEQATAHTLLMEVKQVQYVDPAIPRWFKLDLTTPQKTFLAKWDRAGTPACVGSFVQDGTGIGGLWFAVYSLSHCKEHDWLGSTVDHERLGDAKGRNDKIPLLIRRFLGDWRFKDD